MTKTQFRHALSQLGLSQGQAAKALDVTLRTISNWANGHWPIPRVVELAILYLQTKGAKR